MRHTFLPSQAVKSFIHVVLESFLSELRQVCGGILGALVKVHKKGNVYFTCRVRQAVPRIGTCRCT